MSTVPATAIPRVAQLVRMFGFDRDGEVLNAVRAIGRTLRASGADFHALADRIEHEPAPRIVYRERPTERGPHVAPAWGNSSRLIVEAKLRRAIADGVLTPWETTFAASIAAYIASSRSWRPTPKQEARLDGLMAKLEAMGAWV